MNLVLDSETSAVFAACGDVATTLRHSVVIAHEKGGALQKPCGGSIKRTVVMRSSKGQYALASMWLPQHTQEHG